jgi:hypothetical protein
MRETLTLLYLLWSSPYAWGRYLKTGEMVTWSSDDRKPRPRPLPKHIKALLWLPARIFRLIFPKRTEYLCSGKAPLLRPRLTKSARGPEVPPYLN